MKDRPSVKLVHLFTVHGKTYTFRDVEDFATNESVITFRYTAASDGRLKSGMFYVANLAGFSVSLEP